MTQRIFTLTLALLVTLSFAPRAQAYVEIEDFLRQNNRRAEETAKEREEESRERHMSAPKGETGTGEKAASDDTAEPPSADTETPEEETGKKSSGEVLMLDPEAMRLLQRLVKQEEQSTEILHPGAPLEPQSDYPLSPTGTGTVAAVLTMMAALLWTGYRFVKTEREI